MTEGLSTPRPRVKPRRAACWLAGLALALGCRDPRRAAGDDPRVRYEARALGDVRGRVRFAWPGSSFRVRFRGAGLRARITDAPFEDTLRDTDRLGVEVDGGPLRPLALREGTHEYALAAGLGAGPHELRAVKLTEAEVGTVRLDALTAEGELLPAPPAAARRVLAVGDSITAGYGVGGRDARCGYDAALNDASRAWAWRAAEALGAELHAVAWSGRGLVRNYDPAAQETLLDLFPRAIPTEGAWGVDPRSWRYDDVVINVGTNDAARPGFAPAPFTAALGGLVRALRGLSPGTRVVLAVGPLLRDGWPVAGVPTRGLVLEAARRVAALERARAPGRVTVLVLPEATPAEGLGCGGHPSAATHARLGALLAARLRE